LKYSIIRCYFVIDEKTLKGCVKILPCTSLGCDENQKTVDATAICLWNHFYINTVDYFFVQLFNVWNYHHSMANAFGIFISYHTIIPDQVFI